MAMSNSVFFQLLQMRQPVLVQHTYLGVSVRVALFEFELRLVEFTEKIIE